MPLDFNKIVPDIRILHKYKQSAMLVPFVTHALVFQDKQSAATFADAALHQLDGLATTKNTSAEARELAIALMELTTAIESVLLPDEKSKE